MRTTEAYLDLHRAAPPTAMLDREINNREFAHYRSEFEHDETRKRHLIRLWFRAHGRRFSDG